MTIIEQIKAEIEKRIHSIENCPFIEAEFGASEKRDGKLIAYKDLLSFLSTLESEKPMDLGERIGSYNIVPYIDDKIAALQDMWREEKVAFDWDDLKDMIEDVARHFAQWGAEHAPLPEDTVLFNKGVEEGKRLMMEEFPKWKKIKAGEKLPCPAYVWTIAYDNYPDCFEGRLMPNIQGVKVGRDTWYLPVDVIHNLPKED